MFSLITYLYNNVWNAIVIHILWNLFFSGFFWISPLENNAALINYIIDSKNVLITGSRFGIGSGLPAIMVYTVVIIMLLFLGRNQKADRKDVNHIG